MKRASLLVLLMFACAFTFGCGRKPAALIGTWAVDADKTAADFAKGDDFKKLPEEQQKKAMEEMKKGLATATIAFTDSKATASFGTNKEEADYTATMTDNNNWSLDMTTKDKKKETTALVWADNDHISLKKDANTIYLTRKP